MQKLSAMKDTKSFTPEPCPSVLEEMTVTTETLYFGYSKEKIATIVFFALVQLSASTVYSLQASFYPNEAVEKGATAFEYALVLGVFQLTMVIMSPICGIILGFHSPRRVYNVGIKITAVSTILFGFVNKFEDLVVFLFLSMILRILQAIGEAAFLTASFTIIQEKFPESQGTTTAALESFWGLGTILGLSVGGALYQVGSFLLPFLVMGSCLFIMSFLTYCLMPEVTQRETPDDNTISIISVLKIPEVLLAFFSLTVAASSVGFLISTLEPHLRENFGLQPGMIGLVFMIDGFMYAICTPIWGALCDKSSRPKMYTILGAVLSLTGFLLIGPAPFLPLDTTFWLTCVGLAIHGIGTSASYLSGFIQALQGSVNNGLPDNVATHGLVSGWFMSILPMGVLLGSSIGIILETFGFQIGSLYVIATQILNILIASLCVCIPNRSKQKALLSSSTNLETDTLLNNEHTFNDSFKEDLIELKVYHRNQSKTQNSNKSPDYGAT